MTITTIASETYEQQQQLDPATAHDFVEEPVAESKCSPISCPKLFWAGLGVFAANLAVLFGVVLSPELRVGVYGDETPAAYAASVDKPSPFTPVVEEGKPRKVKLAERVHPVLYQEPVMADNSAAAPTELSIPRASQAAASMAVYSAPSSGTVTGNAVYRQVESYGDFRRVTAASQELVPPTPRRVTN